MIFLVIVLKVHEILQRTDDITEKYKNLHDPKNKIYHSAES